jgi:hypothetical protein
LGGVNLRMKGAPQAASGILKKATVGSETILRTRAERPVRKWLACIDRRCDVVQRPLCVVGPEQRHRNAVERLAGPVNAFALPSRAFRPRCSSPVQGSVIERHERRSSASCSAGTGSDKKASSIALVRPIRSAMLYTPPCRVMMPIRPPGRRTERTGSR